MGGDWQVSAGYRWLYSDRHFRGDEEEEERQEFGTEVVNDSHFFDLSVLYAITPRWSVGATVPFVNSERSSLYEHPGSGRRTSRASGIGDVRLGAYAWVLDPVEMPRWNLSLGLGPKFPTGEYDAKDTFYTNNMPIRGTVDQSIQPGDGGYGFSAELFGFMELMPRTSGYVQGFYLFNPENENGASTTTGRPRGNPHEAVMSITDQYLGRAGLSYLLWPEWGLTLSLGGRIEGIPVRDAIGENDGFRRPGYAVSVEPGLSLAKNHWFFNVSAPVAVYRNRQQSVADKRWTSDTGIHRHGDAAFADYVITASVSRRF
jgi:hypothetical protein